MLEREYHVKITARMGKGKPRFFKSKTTAPTIQAAQDKADMRALDMSMDGWQVLSTQVEPSVRSMVQHGDVAVAA